MKTIVTAICCTAMMFCPKVSTVYASETLDRDYIESEIWEDMWHGKGDDGKTFPEASYKHHLLDQWINDNYGSDEYDWSEIGELKYEYKPSTHSEPYMLISLCPSLLIEQSYKILYTLPPALLFKLIWT